MLASTPHSNPLPLPLLLLLLLVRCSPSPILELPLTLLPDSRMTTKFSIGSSQILVLIDISFPSLEICCKMEDNWLQTAYYFMRNPFRQDEDYRCHGGEGGWAKDTALFSGIGPLQLPFRETVFPNCTLGRLGFSKKSVFLALLPVSERFYVLQRKIEGTITNWVLTVGGSLPTAYSYLPTTASDSWEILAPAVSFSDYSLGPQTLALITDTLELALPTPIYRLVTSELTRKYDCLLREGTLVCPCYGGISLNFPRFAIPIGNSSFTIDGSGYLTEEDEICGSIIRESRDSSWRINVQLFTGDLLFDYSLVRVGFAASKPPLDRSELIDQPVQLMLNCAVVLLLCFFVAMLFIEVIKHVTALETASRESFEGYMMRCTD